MPLPISALKEEKSVCFSCLIATVEAWIWVWFSMLGQVSFLSSFTSAVNRDILLHLLELLSKQKTHFKVKYTKRDHSGAISSSGQATSILASSQVLNGTAGKIVENLLKYWWNPFGLHLFCFNWCLGSVKDRPNAQGNPELNEKMRY